MFLEEAIGLLKFVKEFYPMTNSVGCLDRALKDDLLTEEDVKDIIDLVICPVNDMEVSA